MRRIGLVLAGLAVLAGQGRGPAQVGGDPTAGYEVTPALGPWMIITGSYTGPQAKGMARKLADELRTAYQLPAYIYNFDSEERRQERERIERIRRQQQEQLSQLNPESGNDEDLMRRAHTPRRSPVPTYRFEDQCAVLIGGYRDQDTARKALDQIKKLKPLDPKRVPLAGLIIANPEKKRFEPAYCNPFHEAFTVPNPTVKRAPPADRNRPDPFLKTLNANEPFNLLKCPRRFTLAVAQYQGATVVQSQSTGSSFLEKLGLGSKQGEMLNASAVNAHNVADLLRKLNFEAYVLHTRYASVVTVGNYDTPNDPQLKAAQHRLALLKPKLAPIPMLPEARPMEVPRP
jgi:hypothetical protein